jgi:hypothetical protein
MCVVGDVNCKTCANLDSCWCEACYHNSSFSSHYEELLIGMGSRPDYHIPYYFIFENSTGRVIICPIRSDA